MKTSDVIDLLATWEHARNIGSKIDGLQGFPAYWRSRLNSEEKQAIEQFQGAKAKVAQKMLFDMEEDTLQNPFKAP